MTRSARSSPATRATSFAASMSWATSGWVTGFRRPPGEPPGWRHRELYMQRIGAVHAGGRGTVVAHFADESALGERVAGWEDVCGTSGSVRWLLRRLDIDDSRLPATAGAGEA